MAALPAMKKRVLQFGLAGVSLLVACSAIVRSDLFSGDLIKVPHQKHTEQGVACLSCHEEIYDAKDMEKSFRPSEEKCLECHKEDKDNGKCDKCHTDVKKAAAYPKRERLIVINHQKHINDVKEIGEKCEICHKQLPEPTRARNMSLPMEACLECHNHRQQYNEGRCDACHVELTRYPLKPVADFSHNTNFTREHGRQARASSATCALCHEQTFCSDCHAKTTGVRPEIKYSERVDRDFIHRNDWITRHPLEAQWDASSCKRCHGTSFCNDCHTAQNLTKRGADPRNPHPAGYAFPGSKIFHGDEARRDIVACSSCHDQGAASNCVGCHKVGGIGGNPHPPGFSDRHPKSQIDQNGMCRYCHAL